VLHPAYEEQIPEGPAGPVAHTKLRFAKPARAMGDGNLHHSMASDP